MFELNNFDSMQIGIASPEKIREWSFGEVTKAETVNYRSAKPEFDGLFCERIFGPVKDGECHCGHYKKGKHRGVVCDKCGVKVTDSKVRRERMGHIELAVPVAHIWYYKGTTSRISIIADMAAKDVESILNYSKSIVIDPKEIEEIKAGDLIDNYREMDLEEKYGYDSFKVLTGGEAMIEILSRINLEEESKKLKEIIADSQGQKQSKAIKRLELIEAFRQSGAKPEWMILTALPVLPAGLRPLIDLDGGKRATSDLNELYRKVIIDNNRLKKSIECMAPTVMLNAEKRKLQESVDALIDNEKKAKPMVASTSNRNLKSLTSYLKGKQGRFRQNLLGKRVDYSGRSVIVVGPELKMYQCGLPKEMAKELFKPFIRAELARRGIADGRRGREMVERGGSEVYDILADVIKDHPVLLNRAPTLHRLGIQAFQPILVDGNAIQLHPLVCTAFNADFDGDQMAVHVPLSLEAQAEARFLMLSTNNILKLSDGSSVVSPTQDMLLGSYYLTLERPLQKNPTEDGRPRIYASPEEAIVAYQMKIINLQEPIQVRFSKEIDGELVQKRFDTTVGKIIFNSYIPQDLGFVDRSTKEGKLELEIQKPVNKKLLGEIILRCYKQKGSTETAKVLDEIKRNGFKYSTLVALTANIYDMKIPKEKEGIVNEANKKTLMYEEQYNKGRMTAEGRYKQVIEVWKKAAEDCKEIVQKQKDIYNDMWMMADSGARGNIGQIAQIVSMKGLVVSTSGVIELPIKASFREGLSVLEYFIASHASRKTLSDTAIKTADSGYLTRKLVDVAHDVVITEDDCGDITGTEVEGIFGAQHVPIATLAERINGRFTAEAIKDPKTDEVIVEKDVMISDEDIKKIEAAGITKVRIRSILSCKCKRGICAKCYGRNMASTSIVHKGEAVGVIAAQSIGEPGTQLTMRTFHSGGVALTTDDITQGLPRVNEILDKRKPKVKAVLAKEDGVVKYDKKNDKSKIIVISKVKENSTETIKETEYDLKNLQACVEDGDFVKKGDALSIGSKDLDDLMLLASTSGVQNYIMQEVLSIYSSAGVPVNPKHIEIIINQMLRRVRVEHPGDTSLIIGDIVERSRFMEENEKIINSGSTNTAKAKRLVQGITKAALSNESFLSAASFQETPRMLTEAAIKHKKDYLLGLKENVILGKLIPAGTGLKEYNNIALETEFSESKITENQDHVDMEYLNDEGLIQND